MVSKSKQPKVSKGIVSVKFWNRKNKILVGSGGIALLLFGLVVPVTAMQFENHNSFCASCHTEGEKTFYNRSVARDAVDLASIHNIEKQARCIDCHTGPGITGRYRGLMAGTTDLISYYSGVYPQPAVLEEPYPDVNCIKCHEQVINRQQEFNFHYHSFLPRWQGLDENAATCISCHLSHDVSGDIQIEFLNNQIVSRVCKECHSYLSE